MYILNYGQLTFIQTLYDDDEMNLNKYSHLYVDGLKKILIFALFHKLARCPSYSYKLYIEQYNI